MCPILYLGTSKNIFIANRKRSGLSGLFDWIGFNLTNFYVTMLLNPKQSNCETSPNTISEYCLTRPWSSFVVGPKVKPVWNVAMHVVHNV